MRKRAEKRAGEQGKNGPVREAFGSVAQMVLPMVAGMASTKKDLMTWVHQAGLRALDQIFEQEAEAIAGPKQKHNADRTHHHWGRAPVELPFGGRHIRVTRPRVRTKGGMEETLASVKQFQELDPLPARVVEQILLGVSTRGYGRSLEPLPEEVPARGTSKSAASRRLIEATRAKLRGYLDQPLGQIDVVALMLDGLLIAKHTVIVALAVALDGTKHPLGLWVGSTENAVVCTELVQNLISRGLRVDRRILCVIDGGKGIRKALLDVLGDRALLQRCQIHKMRNVREHLPESRQLYVLRMMRDAYRSTTAATARKRLQQVASWLEKNGEDDAAASLREGLEETLTVLKLGLSSRLTRFFATTNAIENLLSTVRRVTRNVKRWRDGSMVRRWTGLGLMHAADRFRRIRGYRDLHQLASVLRGDAGTEATSEAA